MSQIKVDSIVPRGGLGSADGGGITQCVTTTLTSAFSWTTKNSWVDMTGISATITPKSSSSKILIQVMLSTGDGGNNYERAYRVLRGSTNIVQGPSFSNQMVRASFATGMGAYASNSSICTIPYIYLDSPNTTSATTYKLQGWASNNSSTTSWINRPYVPAASASAGCISTMILMEISG